MLDEKFLNYQHTKYSLILDNFVFRLTTNWRMQNILQAFPPLPNSPPLQSRAKTPSTLRCQEALWSHLHRTLLPRANWEQTPLFIITTPGDLQPYLSQSGRTPLHQMDCWGIYYNATTKTNTKFREKLWMIQGFMFLQKPEYSWILYLQKEWKWF